MKQQLQNKKITKKKSLSLKQWTLSLRHASLTLGIEAEGFSENCLSASSLFPALKALKLC